MNVNRRAFTIVELLVVVAIIALLVAILLPVITRARAHALLVACKSNIRQVLAAHATYACDFKDAKPPLTFRDPTQGAFRFVGFTTKEDYKPAGQGLLIAGRLRTLRPLLCPSAEMAADNDDDFQHWGDRNRERSGSSYAYFYWGGPLSAGSLPVSQFGAGVTYRKCAARGWRAMVMDINADSLGPNYSSRIGGPKVVAHSRLDRVNVGYSDGSVRDFDGSQIRLRYPASNADLLAWFDEANRRY